MAAKPLYSPFSQPKSIKNKFRLRSDPESRTESRNMVHERAKRAAQEFGDAVEFTEIQTFDRCVFCEWGLSDALFIDGKEVRTGPPPSYEKIRNKIAKRVKKNA